MRAKAGSFVASKVGVERPAKVARVAASSCGITGSDGSVKLAGLGSMFIQLESEEEDEGSVGVGKAEEKAPTWEASIDKGDESALLIQAGHQRRRRLMIM